MAINHDRWALAQNLAEHWWPPLAQEDRVTEGDIPSAEQSLGVKLPLALREWYEWAGCRQDFIGNSDDMLSPARLEIEDGALIFCIENQAVARWAIRLTDMQLEDPPVVEDDQIGWARSIMYERGSEVDDSDLEYGEKIRPGVNEQESHDGQWKLTGNRFSEFMLGQIIEATLQVAPYGSFNTGSEMSVLDKPVSQEVLAVIKQHYERIGVGNRRLVQVLGDRDTLILIGDSVCTNTYLEVGAFTQTAFDRYLAVLLSESEEPLRTSAEEKDWVQERLL